MFYTKVDLLGFAFGLLEVIAPASSGKNGDARWVCKCDCGREITTTANRLKKGRTVSCGCLKHFSRGKSFRLSGFSLIPEYDIWRAIIRRCENPKDPNYKNYGGRGIGICKKWRDSFHAFLVDVGQRPEPKLTLDRINNNGNYEPGNIRWATRQQQYLNSRSYLNRREA